MDVLLFDHIIIARYHPILIHNLPYWPPLFDAAIADARALLAAVGVRKEEETRGSDNCVELPACLREPRDDDIPVEFEVFSDDDVLLLFGVDNPAFWREPLDEDLAGPDTPTALREPLEDDLPDTPALLSDDLEDDIPALLELLRLDQDCAMCLVVARLFPRPKPPRLLTLPESLEFIAGKVRHAHTHITNYRIQEDQVEETYLIGY